MTFGVVTSSTNPGPAVSTPSTETQTPKSSDGFQMGQSTGDKIGFYGTGPIVQQASTVDLTAQLVALGLVPAGTAIQSVGGNIPVVNATASTLTVTAALHAGRVVTLNRAAGIAVTLPAGTGTGNDYIFVIGTTVTSNSITLTTDVTGASSDAFQGIALTNDTGTLTGWPATAGAGGSDVITLNGTTTGGFVGDRLSIKDIGAGIWQINSILTKSTGTAATPFSHT